MIYYIRIEKDTSRLSWGEEQAAILLQKRKASKLSRRKLVEKLPQCSEELIRKLEVGIGKKDEVTSIDSSLLLAICKALDTNPKSFKYDVHAQLQDF